MSRQIDIYLAVQRANIYAPELTDLEKATQIGQSFQIQNVSDLINEYKIGRKEWERDRMFQESEEW
jgi:hypothetical protein